MRRWFAGQVEGWPFSRGREGHLQGRERGNRIPFRRINIPTTFSSSTSSSSEAKRCFIDGSIAFIGVNLPPNSSPGSPWYMRPSASLKWYLRVFES